MNLKEYIKQLIESAEPGEIYIEINLNSDLTVSSTETGNKVKFTVHKDI